MSATLKTMNRLDVTRRLVALLKNDEAVIGGIGNNNFDLWNAGHRPQNFYMLGSMGLAASIAFGVAIAQPERRVFAIEGDGSILMELGSLATIAKRRPRNLAIIVMDNGMYQITGRQPTATGEGADIVAMAKGAGIADAHWATNEEDFERLVRHALAAEAPVLIAVKIDGEPPKGHTDRDPAQIRQRFMIGLGVRKAV